MLFSFANTAVVVYDQPSDQVYAKMIRIDVAGGLSPKRQRPGAKFITIRSSRNVASSPIVPRKSS
jgi:hypothetical protein